LTLPDFGKMFRNCFVILLPPSSLPAAPEKCIH
jgi:hypothetical protein